MAVMRLIVAAAAVVLLLAGCTAAPEPTPTPTVTATPSPTPEPQGDPQPRLPVTCPDVFSDDGASLALGSPVSLKVGDDAVRNPGFAQERQVGTLTCIWGGASMTNNSWDTGIALRVLPDADAEFDRGVWSVDDGAIMYPEGELSEYICSDAGTWTSYPMCRANILLDGYWAQAVVTFAHDELSITPEAGESAMRGIVDVIRTTVASADAPRPAWVVPAGSLEGHACDGRPATLDEATLGDILELVARDRAPYRWCEWSEGVTVTVLAGGAWAIDGLEAYGDRPYWSVPPFSAVSVAGADAALAACELDCVLVAAVGGSLVSIHGPGPDVPSFIAGAQPILAEVAAAG
jgi:hypothetical protein